MVENSGESQPKALTREKDVSTEGNWQRVMVYPSEGGPYISIRDARGEQIRKEKYTPDDFNRASAIGPESNVDRFRMLAPAGEVSSPRTPESALSDSGELRVKNAVAAIEAAEAEKREQVLRAQQGVVTDPAERAELTRRYNDIAQRTDSDDTGATAEGTGAPPRSRRPEVTRNAPLDAETLEVRKNNLRDSLRRLSSRTGTRLSEERASQLTQEIESARTESDVMRVARAIREAHEAADDETSRERDPASSDDTLGREMPGGQRQGSGAQRQGREGAERLSNMSEDQRNAFEELQRVNQELLRAAEERNEVLAELAQLRAEVAGLRKGSDADRLDIEDPVDDWSEKAPGSSEAPPAFKALETQKLKHEQELGLWGKIGQKIKNGLEAYGKRPWWEKALYGAIISVAAGAATVAATPGAIAGFAALGASRTLLAIGVTGAAGSVVNALYSKEWADKHPKLAAIIHIVGPAAAGVVAGALFGSWAAAEVTSHLDSLSGAGENVANAPAAAADGPNMANIGGDGFSPAGGPEVMSSGTPAGEMPAGGGPIAGAADTPEPGILPGDEAPADAPGAALAGSAYPVEAGSEWSSGTWGGMREMIDHGFLNDTFAGSGLDFQDQESFIHAVHHTILDDMDAGEGRFINILNPTGGVDIYLQGSAFQADVASGAVVNPPALFAYPEFLRALEDTLESDRYATLYEHLDGDVPGFLRDIQESARDAIR